MELSTNIGWMIGDVKKNAKIAKESGFNKIDFLPPVDTDDYLEVAKDYKDYFDKIGLNVNQSHAPFFRYDLSKPFEDFKYQYTRAVESAHILGVKDLVVHADEYRVGENNVIDDKVALDFTYNYLAPVVELAKKYNINIAIENLFEDGMYHSTRSRFTSKTEDILALLNKFNDSAVTVCWDTGHSRCAYGENHFEEFKRVAEKVSCTHIHDNVYSDGHRLPLTGKIDFNKYVEYFNKIGYKGDFTYELVYHRIPEELIKDFMVFAVKVGNYMLKK